MTVLAWARIEHNLGVRDRANQVRSRQVPPVAQCAKGPSHIPLRSSFAAHRNFTSSKFWKNTQEPGLEELATHPHGNLRPQSAIIYASWVVWQRVPDKAA